MSTPSIVTPRVVAIVGPLGSGKTALLEALLLACRAIPKKGSARTKDTVGDTSPEARSRGMGVDTNLASAEFAGERWTFVDCAGSPEFAQETRHALRIADVAVVVVDPEPARALAASPVLHALDEARVPHVLFVNKIDRPGAGTRLKQTVEALQAVSERPLILREVPIRAGEDVTGFVDVVSEKAFGFKGHEDAALPSVPDDVSEEEHEARRALLEKLADYDDHLLEEILEDVRPPDDEIEANLRKDLQADLVVDVFFGSAEGDHGVVRLLDALRGEAPDVTVTAARNGVPDGQGFLAQSFKTVHAPHVGKLSWVRVWRGDVSDTEVLGSHRVAGVYRPLGASNQKLPEAHAGEVVALGHLDSIRTGQGIAESGAVELPWTEVIQPAAALTVQTTKRGDEVKLSASLAKLSDEDPSLQIEQNPETHDQILWGQGEQHLRLALERLKTRFGLEVSTGAPQVPYRETIRSSTSVHGRFKHQSGGHGAFGDVQIEIEPMPRGEGYAFEERIVGGVVPRQYFSSVDKGAREFMKQGPLGYPMVDMKVVLVHGSYHTVDSSDAAFQQATRVALTDGVPKCSPALLEPVLELEICIPTDATARVQRMVGSRRGGQLLGYDTRHGWSGWDVVKARMPQAELRDLVTELRSLTQGVGTFTWAFHHLQEVDAKEAERVVEIRKKYLADKRG